MPTARRSKRADEILDAAIQVFYERGYAEATVQDVADAVGMLKGSLYHYIKTKEDLLFQLFELVHEQVELIKEAAEKAEGLDPVQRLEIYVERQVEYNLANIQRISVYYHDLGLLGSERLAYVRAERRAHNIFVTGLIEEAQSQGLADDSYDPRMLANCVFSTIIWTYRWYREGSVGRPRAAALTSFFALRGIGAPD